MSHNVTCKNVCWSQALTQMSQAITNYANSKHSLGFLIVCLFAVKQFELGSVLIHNFDNVEMDIENGKWKTSAK